MKKKTTIILFLFALTIFVMSVVAILLMDKTKKENYNDLPDSNTLLVDISNEFKNRYSLEENNNTIIFKDNNYLRNTSFTNYTGTIKKVVITAGCNDDDKFIIISVLTTDGLYAITLDDDTYYRETLKSYSLSKISNQNDIETIYAGNNNDNNLLICKRYPYVKYLDGTIKVIEPTRCDNNYYCFGELSLVNIK